MSRPSTKPSKNDLRGVVGAGFDDDDDDSDIEAAAATCDNEIRRAHEETTVFRAEERNQSKSGEAAETTQQTTPCDIETNNNQSGPLLLEQFQGLMSTAIQDTLMENKRLRNEIKMLQDKLQAKEAEVPRLKTSKGDDQQQAAPSSDRCIGDNTGVQTDCDDRARTITLLQGLLAEKERENQSLLHQIAGGGAISTTTHVVPANRPPEEEGPNPREEEERNNNRCCSNADCCLLEMERLAFFWCCIHRDSPAWRKLCMPLFSFFALVMIVVGFAGGRAAAASK